MEKYIDDFYNLLKEYPLLAFNYLDTKKLEENKSNIIIDDSLIIKGNFDMLLFNGYFLNNKN